MLTHSIYFSDANSLRHRRAQAGHDATQRRAQTVAVAIREKAAAALVLDDAAVVAQSQMASVKAANRAEALRLAAELKQIKMERQFLNADADKMEEDKYRGLANGIVRSTKEKQARGQD